MNYFKQGDLLEVIWVDACLEEPSIPPELARELEPKLRKNIGYCIKHDKKQIIICFGIIENLYKGNNACDITMAIPTGMLQGIKKLK